ncbi:MAG: hypothetical protein RR856_12510, partial [Acinetobacter sp.]
MLIVIAQFLQSYWLIPILIAVISFWFLLWKFLREYWIPAKNLSQKTGNATIRIIEIRDSKNLT